MEKTLKLVNGTTLYLCDNENNIVAQYKPRWTMFNQFKRVRENCNIIKESDDGFTKDNKSKANIYCLDDDFKIKWIINAPSKNDRFPNPIMWDKETVRRQKEDGYLTLDIVDNYDTFICSSWAGFTVTVDYETGQIIKQEFTK
jgi:hypothetical protein